MSRFESITAELRSAPDFVPACPLCSFLARPDGLPDIVTAPSMLRQTRQIHSAPGKARIEMFRIQGCCPWSDLNEWHETAAAAAAQWRAARIIPHSVPALANRQAGTLAKLAAANLEACAKPPPDPPAPAERWEEQAQDRRLNLSQRDFPNHNQKT